MAKISSRARTSGDQMSTKGLDIERVMDNAVAAAGQPETESGKRKRRIEGESAYSSIMASLRRGSLKCQGPNLILWPEHSI